MTPEELRETSLRETIFGFCGSVDNPSQQAVFNKVLLTCRSVFGMKDNFPASAFIVHPNGTSILVSGPIFKAIAEKMGEIKGKESNIPDFSNN